MKERLVEHVFFFGIFGLVGYLIWQIVAPFLGALALAAIIATVCYPFYLRVLRLVPRRNRPAGALISVVLIACTIFIPLFILSYVLFVQAVTFYEAMSGGSGGFTSSLATLETNIETLFPGLSLDLAGYAQQGAGWLASHMGAIFAGTASTVFLLFIMLVALYYMLKDGPEFVKTVVRLSPLPDSQDEHILAKLSLSVRSVVLGTLAVAMIQGLLTAIGFTIFGVSQPVLWGSVAAVGALIPGVGTSFVFIGAVAVSLLAGSYGAAIGLAVWGMFAVGLVDNFLGPYLMSRGAKLHPFAVLLSVLGGVVLFGPIGFLVGPVALSLFTVLLELYSLHIARNRPSRDHA
jgi:predicted PurR-regulated permease PerM